MAKYRVIAIVAALVYVGDVEGEDSKEAWKRANLLLKDLQGKRVDKDDIDDDFYIEDIDSLEPDDGIEYLPVKAK